MERRYGTSLGHRLKCGLGRRTLDLRKNRTPNSRICCKSWTTRPKVLLNGPAVSQTYTNENNYFPVTQGTSVCPCLFELKHALCNIFKNFFSCLISDSRGVLCY